MPEVADIDYADLLQHMRLDPDLAASLIDLGITDKCIQKKLREERGDKPRLTKEANEGLAAAKALCENAAKSLSVFVERQPNRQYYPLTSRPNSRGRLYRNNLESFEARLESASRAVANAQEELDRAVYNNWAKPIATKLINETAADSDYRSALPDRPGSGLAEVYNPAYEEITTAVSKLHSLFTNMPGGSIGISGLRGSGKSTLIRSTCRNRPFAAVDGPSIGFTASAPVRYDAREFILYLFARLCQEVLDIPPEHPPRVERAVEQSVKPARRRWLRAIQVLLALVGAFLIVTGSVGTRWEHVFVTGTFRIVIGSVLLVAAPLVRTVAEPIMAAIGVIVSRIGFRESSAPRPGQRHNPTDSRLKELFNLEPDTAAHIFRDASAWLDEIRYQLTYTSGWSGSLNVSVAQVSANQSHEAAERQRTLPAIVAGYRGLIRQVSDAGIKVFIGIDELDKLETEDEAQLFLNEIKSIFGSENCFYLVSISENAMSSFERRGLPFRDVFDSVFDEVVRIDLFTYQVSRALLNRRTVMSTPFTVLCHCVSGGLPRDLIRTARTLYRLNIDEDLNGSLKALTAALIREDLHAKMAASWVRLSSVNFEPQATSFGYWLRETEETPVEGQALYESCRDFWAKAAEWPRATAGRGASSADSARLTALGLEVNTYRYFAATILQFLGQEPPDEKLRTAYPASHKANFEMLARARLLFAHGPALAWKMISDFRDAHGLQVLPSPDPCWLDAIANKAAVASGESMADGHQAV